MIKNIDLLSVSGQHANNHPIVRIRRKGIIFQTLLQIIFYSESNQVCQICWFTNQFSIFFCLSKRQFVHILSTKSTFIHSFVPFTLFFLFFIFIFHHTDILTKSLLLCDISIDWLRILFIPLFWCRSIQCTAVQGSEG